MVKQVKIGLEIHGYLQTKEKLFEFWKDRGVFDTDTVYGNLMAHAHFWKARILGLLGGCDYEPHEMMNYDVYLNVWSLHSRDDGYQWQRKRYWISS